MRWEYDVDNLFIGGLFLNADSYNSSINKLSLHSDAIWDRVVHSAEHCVSIEECPIGEWFHDVHFISLVKTWIINGVFEQISIVTGLFILQNRAVVILLSFASFVFIVVHLIAIWWWKSVMAGPRPKRSCKWYRHDLHVTIQIYWSSRGRNTVSFGSLSDPFKRHVDINRFAAANLIQFMQIFLGRDAAGCWFPSRYVCMFIFLTLLNANANAMYKY